MSRKNEIEVSGSRQIYLNAWERCQVLNFCEDIIGTFEMDEPDKEKYVRLQNKLLGFYTSDKAADRWGRIHRQRRHEYDSRRPNDR